MIRPPPNELRHPGGDAPRSKRARLDAEEVLVRVSALLSADLPESELAQRLAEEACVLLDADGAALLCDAGERVALRGRSGALGALDPAALDRGLPEIGCDEIADEPRLAGGALADLPGLRSYLALPLLGRGGSHLGTLAVVDRDPGAFEGRDHGLLGALAAMGAIAVENLRVYGEAQRARRAAQLERERLQSVFRQVPTPICITSGPDHVVEVANPHFAALAGGADCVGRSLRAIFPDAAAQRFFQPLDDVVATGRTFVGSETPLRRRWGGVAVEERWFSYIHEPMRSAGDDDDGVPAIDRVITLAFDVTEQVEARRRAEAAQEAQRVSEERLRLVTLGAQLGMWHCDLPFDRLVWNTKTKEHFGLPPHAEVKIADFFRLLHPDDRERTRQAIEHAVAERADYDVDYRTVAGEGQVRWIRAIGRASYDALGRPLRFDGITVDVTDARRAAEERIGLLERERAARADAEAANRAKDEFLAMLGHELRNPLAPIVTALELIRLRGDGAPREVKVIERQVSHVVRLVDDLLDVSRITRGKVRLKRAPLSIADVVGKAVEIASPLLELRRHTLRVEVPATLRVDGDEVRLAQVIANLLTNAAKYTEPGGHIEVLAALEGNEVVLHVRDDGVGVAPEILPRVFDLFIQGERSIDRAEGGLGLGLALVRSLVQLHGGRAWVASDGQSRGSDFAIALPALLAQPSHAAECAPAGGEASPRELAARILVVDDNADAAELLAELLKSVGCHVAVAHDGPQAIALAETFHPEVAVLDIGLPVMDGYELARQLRGRLPSLRLIAVTGYGQEADRARSRAAGFERHFVKPVDVAGLVAALGERAGGGSDAARARMA